MSTPGTHQVRNQVIECISGENGDAPGSCQLLGDAAEDDRDVSVPVGVGPAFQGGGRAQVENLRQFYHSFLEQQQIITVSFQRNTLTTMKAKELLGQTSTQKATHNQRPLLSLVKASEQMTK